MRKVLPTDSLGLSRLPIVGTCLTTGALFSRLGRSFLQVSGGISFLCLGLLQGAGAEVVINEIGAASSDRLLRSHPDGRPRLGWGATWCELEFDDADWDTGSAPFGFGAEGIATDLGEAMLGRTPSVYLRKIFTVSEEAAAKAEPFSLSAQADSGFVAYVNGHEIARANLGRLHGFVYHVQSTFSSAESDKMLEYHSSVLASEVLRPGENVFAVQVQNTVPSQINERDTSVDESLKFEVSSFALATEEGGTSAPIELGDEDWRYRVGHAEPSGGVVDWAQAAHPDVEGEFSDWVELHNNGPEEVNLSGWHLTDDEEEPVLWTFPEGTTIPSGGYLLVLADGNTEVPGDFLHANFGLSAEGEFLGLSDANGEFVSIFEDGGFPKQYPFQSYGLSALGEGVYVYFEVPTPGAANGGVEFSGAVKRLRFEPAGGVYDDTVTLAITSNTGDAVIRFTLDGSEPTEDNGTLYEGPLTIAAIDDRTGTPVRARAFKDGMMASPEGTQTYLVGVDEVFKTIPSLSLVADAGRAFFKPHGIMSIEGRNIPRAVSEYYMPAMHGRAFERQISTEFIYPDSETNIQLNGGLRLSASAFSRGNFFLGKTEASPWESRPAEKPSFNLFYRRDYGDETVDFPIVENYPVRQFRQFRLRAGKNDITNPWITDEMARRVYTDTGQFGAVGMQCALFVNGSYKGYYNPVARLREGLLQDVHGSKQPWAVKHIDVWADGSPFADKLKDIPEWDHLEELLAKDLRILENYEALVEELDPVNFADYFIVNLYGATLDWPHNNLVIARELSENGRWRAYMWDAEGIFGVQSSHSLTHDSITSELENGRTSPSDDLATVWSGLIKSPEWKLLFADRLQKHFFSPGGALTQENLRRRRDELAHEMTPLLAFSGETMDTSEIDEWIDGREEVLFTTGDYWEPRGLWGQTEVPILTPAGGTVEAGTPVKISVGTVEKRSSIYYTTDGSDPRLPGGELSPSAVVYDLEGDAGIVLETATTIKARVQIKTVFSSTWGALQESHFRVGMEAAGTGNILISEFLADPEGPNDAEEAAGFSASDFEFLEFYNPGEVTIDLAELRFTDGINYDFGEGEITTLGPQAYGVIVNDRAAFVHRYGEGLPILGEYGRKLSNGGELLEIIDGKFKTVIRLAYSDEAPWPSAEEGRSLVLSTLEAGSDPNDPANWVASADQDGTPGRAAGADPPSADGYEAWTIAQFAGAEVADASISGMDSDPDGDGASNLLEFALGTDPKDGASIPVIAVQRRAFVVNGDPGDYLVLALTERSASGLRYQAEFSSDLATWQTVSPEDLVEMDSQPDGMGLRRATYRTAFVLDAASAPSHVRWHVELTAP